MKMPEEARQEFDQLLTRPLRKTGDHRREVAALERALEEAGATEGLAVARRTIALLDRIERKTSPLYQRLIHAAAAYVTREEAAADWGLRGRVVSAVAHSTKHFDLVE